MTALGRHLLAEFYGCNREIINNIGQIKRFMEGAAVRAGATVVQSVFHPFKPFGVSGVVVIAESHLAIHSWPEYSYAAVDVFTCGEDVDPWVAFNFLKEAFQSKGYAAKELIRGQLTHIKGQLHYKPMSCDSFEFPVVDEQVRQICAGEK
jgi:S-adenosylmethionine decarboxylase proenzyme